jgi:polysaccharide pyruvyl transferase WcaK-like protein
MDCLGRWPLSDVTPLAEEAHRKGKPVAFIGVGTEGLAHAESKQIVGQQLGQVVRQWTVRSQRDSQRLIEWGVPHDRVHVAADMAWLLDPAGPEWGRKRLRTWGVDTNRRLLAVNLLGEKHILAREPRLFEKLAEFLDSAVESHNVFVLFLSNEVREGETFDKAAAHRTLSAMKHPRQALVAPNEYLAPQEMCSLIANCWVTMSMRYHFCLFTALEQVPFIALKRSDKVADLCFDLEWPHGEAIGGLTTSALGRALAAIDQQYSLAAAHLADRVKSLRNRAWTNNIGLEALAARPLAQTA